MTGNQLAVFLDSGNLSAEEMQEIAREMNFSETTFVGSSENRLRLDHLSVQPLFTRDKSNIDLSNLQGKCNFLSTKLNQGSITIWSNFPS